MQELQTKPEFLSEWVRLGHVGIGVGLRDGMIDELGQLGQNKAHAFVPSVAFVRHLHSVG